MAEVALSAFLSLLFGIIKDLLKEELQLQCGSENELTTMASNVDIIRAVLRGAEKMQLSEPQKLWFADLKDVGYDAMEILDEYLYEAQRRQVIRLAPLRNSLSVVNPKRVLFRHHIGAKIKVVTQRMEDIGKKRLTFQLQAHGGGSEHFEGSRLHQSSSLSPTFVYGRQNDQEKIVDMLVRSNLELNVEVLPILGMGYIGKTTVAQVVFNDGYVSRHFELRLWVHVSHEFNIERITASILESIDGYPFHSNNLNTLQRRLQQQLQGRRYLLILDDFWKESLHDWEKLKLPLLNGAAGSKIIVTTRSEVVVRVLGASDPYRLQGLSDEDCWLLFCQYALGTDYSTDLCGLKEEILQKCKGIPFVAISLGHQIHQEKDRSKWAAMLQQENWEFSDSDFTRAIRLSYEQLDSHLKPCFAYSSIIPERFQFEEEWFIQHWMAQGFIGPKPNTERIEDTGSSCFKSLVERSFFQRARIDHTGERHSYNTSRMMHKLAAHVSAEECCILERPCNPPEKVRHLTVVFDKLANHNIFETISRCKYLHTLLVIGGFADYELRVPSDFGQKFRRLRTLDVSNFALTELPVSIGDLKHLRCIQLRCTKIRRLPDSICSLYNLQTLGLRNCYDLQELPHRIKNLRKLRHIDLHLDDHSVVMTPGPCHSACSLRSMPENIGLLTDLQTLSRFVISKGTRHSNICELSKLNSLRGELLISNLHLVKDSQEAAQANLRYKQFLQKLEFSWNNHNVDGQRAMQILESLSPHSNIKELSISGYVSMAIPSWLGSAVYNNLLTLHLYDFKMCGVLPPLGRLPLLENLYMKGWDGLSTMTCDTFCDSGTVNFPSLKKLHLEGMNSLCGWDGDDRCALPSLLELNVKNCYRLQRLAHNLPSLTKITIEGSPNFLGLRNFPSLKCVDVNASGEWIWGSWCSLSSPFSIILCRLPTIHFPFGLGRIHISLQRLEISHCEQLLSLPKDWPPCNLNRFSIRHCPRLCELPRSIQHLRALEDLEIVSCGQLTYLPEMNNLVSLLRLEISDCSLIQSLPTMGLPTSLQFLSINNCPWLSWSCSNVGSPDRAKIMHIFSVWIDEQLVFTSADEPRCVIPAKLRRG